MEVFTCGATFNTQTIAAKQRAGEPLTFGETMAIKYGAQAPARPPSAAATHVAAREVVQEIASTMRQADPKLNESEAFIAALDSNAELAKRYRAEQPGAPQSDQWTAKQMSPKRARVEQLAAERMVAKGITIEAARVQIWDTYPELRA